MRTLTLNEDCEQGIRNFAIMDKSRITANILRVESYPSHCTTPSERNDQQLVPVKVGCLHINPTTVRGRRMFMVQMLVLCFVPHAALVAQNCSVMAQLSQTLDSSLYLHSEVSTTLSVGETIAELQNERFFITKYFFEDPSLDLDINEKSKLEHAFSVTDLRLAELPLLLLHDRHTFNLYRFREDYLNIKPFTKVKFLKSLSVYAEIYSILQVYVTTHVKSTTSTLWRQLSACYEFLKSLEGLSLALVAVNYMRTEALDLQMVSNFEQHQASGVEHLVSTVQYLKAENTLEEFRVLEEILDFYAELNPFKRNDSFKSIEAMPREDWLSVYAQESESCLVKLREVQIRMWRVVRESVKREVWLARRTLGVGVVILTVVLLASPVLVLLIRHTVITIQTFNHSIELSTQRLMAEKQKSDLLLSRMLPLPVLRSLRAQKAVPAEAFDAVTIFFSDIVGFTTISSSSTPMEVINMLNMLYKLFDEKIMQYNVYKVETIGDAYMVVSGLPQRNGNRHASEIADMSLSLMRSLEDARVPHRTDELLRIRAGVNTGPCVAGVVGTTMPRYCLFGDTINVASRMESTGEAMKIHISFSTKEQLDQIGGYEVETRGVVDIAGKGTMETFWLVGKVGGFGSESPRALRLHDYDQNLLELLIRT